MTTKERRNRYLFAAKLIADEKEKYSCNAVARAFVDACGFDGTEEADVYASTMDDLTLEMINDAAGKSFSDHDKRRNFRVLLLCMMAAACGDFANKEKI